MYAPTNSTPLDTPAKIDTATKLAYQRTRLAQDNAVLAWIRTATSLITFGFAVYKFFQIELKGSDRTAQLIGPRGFGLTMISLGLLSILLGTLEHRRAMKELRAQYPDLPRSTAGMLAALMAGLGIVALFVVIYRG